MDTIPDLAGKKGRDARLKQARLDKRTQSPPNLEGIRTNHREKVPTRLMDVNLSEFKTNPLWPILVETTMRSPLYSGLVGYIHDQIIPNNPDISPKELASKLSISIGEALVILDSIRYE
ncbi:MAG: hypothetical protein ACFFED_07020 [Candidatus Thorarchaeota archaeon]